MKKLTLITLLAAFLALGTVPPDNVGVQPEEESSPDHEAFPITVDFHCPRNFGFHIGDEIPLTITLEARNGRIVDLVNLPQKGETHGPFEVRDVRVRKRQVESGYRYRTLFSQPFDILVSRTATYFGPMKDIKGPIGDETVALIWKLTTVGGGLMLLLALITWPWEFIRRRWRFARQTLSPTARDRALKALHEAKQKCFNYEDHRKRLFFEINAILRNLLKEVYGLSTANRPSMEIVNELKDRPFYQELKGLVARINQVVYEGDAPVDVESIMRQFSGLLQSIDGTPPPETNHDMVG